MKAKQLAEIFSGMNPDDEVWATYITKEDVKETFSNVEYTDENDNLIDTDPFVSDDVMERVFNSIDNDDYLWERFNENFSDTCREVLSELIDEKQKAEADKDLWDKEG